MRSSPGQHLPRRVPDPARRERLIAAAAGLAALEPPRIQVLATAEQGTKQGNLGRGRRMPVHNHHQTLSSRISSKLSTDRVPGSQIRTPSRCISALGGLIGAKTLPRLHGTPRGKVPRPGAFARFAVVHPTAGVFAVAKRPPTASWWRPSAGEPPDRSGKPVARAGNEWGIRCRSRPRGRFRSGAATVIPPSRG